MKRLLACGFALMLAANGVAAAPAVTPAGTSPARGTVTQVEPVAGEGTKAAGGHGGEAAETGKDPVSQELNKGEFLVTILIFVALLIVLRAVAWKPILTGLKNRETAIRDSIEAAQRAKNDTERTTRELEAKMQEVQRQASQQLTQAKADALKVADTIRAQAETESAALKDRTLREIDAAKQQAISEINGHAAELGTAVARKILQRNVTVDDQARLVDESLAELAKKN